MKTKKTMDDAVDPAKMFLAADPERPMTVRERRYFAAHMPRLDLPAAITIPTRSGGRLKLCSDRGIVTLIAEDEGATGFAITFPTADFKRSLEQGNYWDCPGVGCLLASPRGLGQARLCLVPQHSTGKVVASFSFVADLSISEVLERL